MLMVVLTKVKPLRTQVVFCEMCYQTHRSQHSSISEWQIHYIICPYIDTLSVHQPDNNAFDWLSVIISHGSLFCCFAKIVRFMTDQLGYPFNNRVCKTTQRQSVRMIFHIIKWNFLYVCLYVCMYVPKYLEKYRTSSVKTNI